MVLGDGKARYLPWEIVRRSPRMDAMVDQTLRDRVSQLSHEDRLELISELWQSIDTDDLEVTTGERELLDGRLRDLHQNPDGGRSWDTIETELRTRLR